MWKSLLEVVSVSGKQVRLTRSIWYDKILVGHPEFKERDSYLEDVKNTIGEPDYVVKGWANELLALKWCETAPKSPKYLCVVYREVDDEGFVITAFFISRYQRLLKREIIWQRK